MESPLISSPLPGGAFSAPSSRSRSSTKLVDDVASLTSFNPFSEEDENDQSSYTLVSSLFSKMKNTFAGPLSSAVAAASGGTSILPNGQVENVAESRRPSNAVLSYQQAPNGTRPSSDRPAPLTAISTKAAPPLVSLTPVVSEVPSFSNLDYEAPPTRGGLFTSPSMDPAEGGTAIPGFPIQDDARSIRTTMSLKRSDSVSKVMRRIRGDGLSRDYWMDDENAKECFDCKSVFTTWRRKHHCRICGQIFCSRCASNIIKGSRFGREGMLRVCNLCLEKLAQVDDEDEDDRRSVTSTTTSPFAAHQLGAESLSIGRMPQSPFAASQLFGRTDEPFNLFSIAEPKKRAARSEDSGFSSRPMTPNDRHLPEALIERGRKATAPFRRGLSEDERDSMSLPDSAPDGTPPRVPGRSTPVDFPITIPVSIDGQTSSVQFPISSPDQSYMSETPGGRTILRSRSRFDSYGEYDSATPFIRSRVQSRFADSIGVGEPGWRTRRESTAYAQELNQISMFHLRIMLRQMLTKEQIPNVKEWEETLLKLALRIARELTFTAYPQRQGADMDVRRYVKIKKIPGGAPRDSEYVDGAVITKNAAHKQMSRSQRNPRIMLVTFPLEFHRVEGQYMHFPQIVRQEKEYLNNLASRIAALRPHVVLVEKSVSRLALDALAKYNITVARSVKRSAISFVARMSQSDVLSSIDKLALEPRLGHCAQFRIQTFDHPLIPGRRKTYMRFEGCSRDMGCTIILRGGDLGTLKKIKKVTRFLTFIVRNLKLETHLWKDSVITLPPLSVDACPTSTGSSAMNPSLPFITPPRMITMLPSVASERKADSGSDDDVDDGLPDDDVEQLRLSKRIQQSLEPYLRTFMSVSATLRFPPPYPIRRMKELDEELILAKQAWEDEVVRRGERAHFRHKQESTVTAASFEDELRLQIEALPGATLSATPKPEGSRPDNVTGYFDLMPPSTASQLSTAPFGMASPLPITPMEEAPLQLRTAADIAPESRLSYVKCQHEEQRRIWEWYLRKNKDDFVVEKYQCLSFCEFTLPTSQYGAHRACFPPQLQYVTFYGENDCTLGQFIEQSATDTLVQFLDPRAICGGKGCNQPLARHCRVYVHNESMLFVAVEQWDGHIQGRLHFPPSDMITTWSLCRVCGSATPFIPVSEEMQRYSFAKFLELHFYPADVQLVQGAGCQHNIYKHHIRYFATRGMTVRFQADPITLHEVVYPPIRIRVRPETLLELKNSDYERLLTRNITWYTALVDDLKLINIDAATGDEEVDARLTRDINALIVRAESEKDEVTTLINKIYTDSPPTDTFALNQVRAFRQDKIVAWQQDFDRLPKPRAPQTLTDKNARRASAFGTVRAMWPRRYELAGALDQHGTSSSVSEAEELPPLPRRPTGDSFASISSASEASESEKEPAEKDSSLLSEAEQSTTEDPSQDSLKQPANPSDPESDSTIGAEQPGTAMDGQVSKEGQLEVVNESAVPRASRLPRRAVQHPSVAELVKKYQEYIPPEGVEDLAQTAFNPNPSLVLSESDQESVSQPRLNRPLPRSKVRHHLPARKPSTSDFEQGYAVNVAPRYLTHARRAHGRTPRAFGAVGSSAESHLPSRQPSPEKRPSYSRTATDVTLRTGRTSPTPSSQGEFPTSRTGKAKLPRAPIKDRLPIRPVVNATNKSSIRRVPLGPGKVSNIAKHFERLTKENERATRRYAVIRGRRARPVATARAKVEVLESVQDVIGDDSESSDSSSEADDEGGDEDESQKPRDESSLEASLQLPLVTVESGSIPSEVLSPDFASEPAKPAEPPLLPASPPQVAQLPMSVPPSPLMLPAQPECEVGPSGNERHSILRALSTLWPQPIPQQQRSRLEPEVDDPMADPEHIFRDSSMVVRTDEPTSIIALALNSPQYREKLARSRAENRHVKEPKLTDGGEAFMPDDQSIAESNSTWGVVNVEVAEGVNPTEEMRVPSSKLPWLISFDTSGLTINCTVLYPEQFDALRRTYDCEKSMIESLARCVKWDANGGKSGSAFLKTRDDRFIAKEVSKAELQTMETFGPAYFDYMSTSMTAGRPTLLAKVLGCFKISFKKKDTSAAKTKPTTHMNLLVMENLFYDRRFSKIYDLKGSTRNRHVRSTGRENEVLLDENLVETAHLTPFYLREHSKRILRGSLYNDSKFLADINVMDYSLVVGVDSQKNELVVGIVDYIRTYTWDKKLESWVKDLGSAGKGDPTIITPKQYRQRFLSAMERYFPLVPDRWMKQKDTPEEEGNSLLDLWPDW
ncbi:hypothetical protein JAAARDRAFT_120591 [Jaapia argillacea MUCL 33604]|uniref:1-phosphatidylinositol-3-phosphate 5-kinase n=1 Tax=Jaapia argillacea MUCL 33604 TaxID=933084 RepID=A0A067QK85_9AGAM|nr:hypothetical protein JAAARDRAFT_120591 [Jaapia argillacea MUCL 33604]